MGFAASGPGLGVIAENRNSQTILEPPSVEGVYLGGYDSRTAVGRRSLPGRGILEPLSAIKFDFLGRGELKTD